MTPKPDEPRHQSPAREQGEHPHPAPAPKKEGHAKQMASEEHLRSIGTLVTPAVTLPPMTTAQADSLEIELVSVRRNERNAILRKHLGG